MKVWIVERPDYGVHSVWSNMDKALAKANEENKMLDMPRFYVGEYEVDR